MALDLTCLNATIPVPEILLINNMTSVPIHSSYRPNGWAISQLISSSMARSTFSTADIRSLLETLTSDDAKPFDLSSITSMKPLKSTIIYLSVTMALFLICSVMFLIFSCVSFCQTTGYRQEKQRKCSGRCVSLVAFVLIASVVTGQMIYTAYQVDRTTRHLDNSIAEFNQEVYPKEISLYLQHLLGQFQTLDQYSTRTDSIVVQASRSMLVKAFDRILRDQYAIDAMHQSIDDSNTHLNELKILINHPTSLLPGVNDTLTGIERKQEKMIEQLNIPLRELCDYADGKATEIDSTILDVLLSVHEQLTKMIETIEKDFLTDLTPWEEAMFIKADMENKIRGYVRLAGTILLVLIIIFGLVPLVFFFVIIVCRYRHRRRQSKYRMTEDRRSRSRQPSNASIDNHDLMSIDSSTEKSSRRTRCWMRIIFMPIIIMLILIVLLSGIFYAVDLFAQGACRTAHEDRAFLVPFLIDELLGSNSTDFMIGGLDVQNTFLTVLDDCANQTHFSRKFFSTHLIRLQKDVNQAMNQLNNKIKAKFIASVQVIDMQSYMKSLDDLSSLFISVEIKNKTQQMRGDLQNIDMQLKSITTTNETVPSHLVDQTVDQMHDYVHRLLNSTIDTCPLPMAIIYKVDAHVCHDFATSINGLWFSLFLYMLCTICGLCFCGLWTYRQLEN